MWFQFNLTLHSSCLAVYLSDEAWMVAQNSLKFLLSTNHTLTGDFLAWYVPQGSSGFPPHRDRQPEALEASFDRDTGMPRYATLWWALTDATPENSCLFVVPAYADPGYRGDGDAVDPTAPSPLQVALAEKKDFQQLRALCGPPGSAWCFSHRIIHWGSQHAGWGQGPRISMSFVSSDSSFEPSFLTRPNEVPSFDVRVALLCGQMICYHDHFPPRDAGTLKRYLQAFQAQLPHFSESYMQKVYVEFVGAAKALGDGVDEELDDMVQACM